MWSNRYVRTIMLSRTLLQLGIWVRNFAVLLYVTDLTNNDALYVSLISVAEFSPIFLFALIGGTLADRWQPKSTMLASDLLSALSVAAVLLAVMNGQWIALLVGSFVSASLSQLSQPSAMKQYKRHVPEEQLQGVMAMSQSLVAIFTVLGPMIGTFVFMQLGIRSSLLLTAMMFLASSIVLATLPRDEKEARTGVGASFMGELLDGIRYIGSNSSLKSLSRAFATAGLAAGMIQPLAIFIVIEKLGLDKHVLQWFLMANGAATLAGGMLVMGIARRIKPQVLLAVGLLVSAVCTAGVGASSIIGVTAALQVISGLFYPCIQIGIQTMIMRGTEGAYIGRVSGAITPIFMGMMVAGMMMSGVLKAMLSLTGVYALSGGLLLVGAMMLSPIRVRSNGQMNRSETQ